MVARQQQQKNGVIITIEKQQVNERHSDEMSGQTEKPKRKTS